MNLELTLKNSSCVSVSWTANNRAANYAVSAMGDEVIRTCTTTGNSCDITDLPCGSTYEISVTAASVAGLSLPSYSDSLETGVLLKALQMDDDEITIHVGSQSSRSQWTHHQVLELKEPFRQEVKYHQAAQLLILSFLHHIWYQLTLAAPSAS